MQVLVRPALVDDIPEMHRLRLAVRENRLSSESGIDEAAYLPFVAGGRAWVAVRDAKIAGFAAVDAATASVWALFVSPDMEGSGVGRSLHDAIVRRACAIGLDRLRLATAGGTRAQGFYRAAGWREVGLTGDGELRLELDLR